MARTLLILAHPLRDSFCGAIAERARQGLAERGQDIDFLDLYREDFDPRLSAAERAAYYAETADLSAVGDYTARLLVADSLVLVFPQWWFNLPAIMKGYFDRVLQPGVAFDHTPGYGKILPRLAKLSQVLAISTLGSPWWVTNLYMGNPVRRQLSRGILAACAPQARFTMLTCYSAEKIGAERRERFLAQVSQAVAGL